MEQRTLKLTSVLSDPTRFSIYQFVSKRHGDVTVQEVAEAFDIHQNVARLHLSKLEDVHLLVAETKKTGKGGRPSRYYRISDEVVQIQFPFRDYQRLAQLAMEALISFGESGKEQLQRLGRVFGKEAVEGYIKQHQNGSIPDLSFDEKLDLIRNVSAQQGLNPELEYNENKQVIDFQVFNCPFKELLKSHSGSLCNMHHSMMEGMFQKVFPEAQLKEKQLMTEEGASACTYQTIHLDFAQKV